MTTPAMRRFDQLRKGYTASIPKSRNISRRRRRECAWAAALSLMIETVAAEIAFGIRSKRPPELDQMRLQVDAHLADAHATGTFDTRASK